MSFKSDLLPPLFSKKRKIDLLILRVGVEKKTSNSLFSPCFSTCYAQNKRAIALVTLLKRGTRAIRTSDSHEKPESKFPSLPDILQPIPTLYLLTWYSSANTSYVSTHLIFWNHSWLVISFMTSLTDSLNNVRAMIEKNTMELFKSLSIFCYMASHVLLTGFNNAEGATKSDLW